eukprot:1195631-Prorocentrum_minimum.AAC.2
MTDQSGLCVAPLLTSLDKEGNAKGVQGSSNHHWLPTTATFKSPERYVGGELTSTAGGFASGLEGFVFDLDQFASGLEGCVFDLDQFASGLGGFVFDLDQIASGLGGFVFDLDQIASGLGGFVFDLDQFASGLGGFVFDLHQFASGALSERSSPKSVTPIRALLCVFGVHVQGRRVQGGKGCGDDGRGGVGGA